MSSILDELNEEQRKAAEKIEGPVLILAGAGSGKTRTVTYRIAHMVKEIGISPLNILALTFTNKAAREMKERAAALIGHEANNLVVSTFHSFSVRLLKTYSERIGYGRNFNIYDVDDQKSIITKIKKEMNIGDNDSSKPGVLANRISKLKEQGIGVNELGQQVDLKIPANKILEALDKNNVTALVGVPRVFKLFYDGIKQQIDSKFITRTIYKLMTKIKSFKMRRKVFAKVHEKFGGKLTFIVSGGAKLDPEIGEFYETLGIYVQEGYGLTETSPVIAVNTREGRKIGTVGKKLDNIEAKIVDEELWVKGPIVMKGYYNKPEKTAEVITEDGWFKTGDLASIDDEGYITIRGRRNSMIVLSNGKNIDPEKLENKVIEKSKRLIKELGVFGHNDKLVAIIVPDLLECRKQGITNIKAYVKNIVEDYNLTVHNYEKILDYKLYEEELPKTRVGKLRRFMLPELYLKTNVKKKKVEEPDNEVYKLLKDYIKKLKGIEAQPEENLELEIGMDSLDIVEFFAYVENSFGIQLDEEKFSEISNLKSLSEYINEKATKIESGEVDWKKIIDAAPPVEEKNRWATRVLRPLFDLIIKLYFRLKRVNRDKLSDKPQIFVSNHQSFIDSLVLGSLLPAGILYNTVFLAIDWYFKKGILKLLVSHGNVVLIDINKNIRKSVEEIAANVKAGKNVLIFPEGARTKDGKVAEFKKVFAIIAKELNVDVQCLGIKGAFEAYSRYMKFPKPKKIEVAVLEKFKPEGTYDEIVEKARNIIKTYVEGK